MGIPNTPDHYHAMVVLKLAAGDVPNERKTWNLYFRNDGVGDADYVADHVQSRLQTFLDTAMGDIALSAGGLIPGYINRTAELRVYDLGQAGTPPAPRTPHLRDLALGAASVATPLPPDCAVRLTIRAADAPTTAQSVTNPKVRPRRRTGGFYFGPLHIAALDTPATGLAQGKVRDQVRNGLAQACEDLASESALHPVRWVLLSPTTGDSWDVTDGFVDAEFDTIRKRGWESRVRTEWAA